MSLMAGIAVRTVQHDPEARLHLGGFAGREPSTGVLEYPQIRVLYLADDENSLRVVLVSADYCNFDTNFVDGVRAQLEKADIQSVIACTHNHCGPAAYHAEKDFTGAVDELYLAYVKSQILEAVYEAAEATTPVDSIAVRRGQAQGDLLMNRTTTGEKVIDGALTPWMYKRWEPDMPARAFTELDLELATLEVYLRDGRKIVLINFACHPITLGASTVAARDFVGPMLRGVECGDPNCTALFFNGAAGDVNPAMHDYGPEAAEHFGNLLATQIVSVLEGPGRRCDQALKFGEDAAVIDYTNGTQHRARMSCLRIGDLSLITVPGELYNSFGLEIKRMGDNPDFAPIVLGYANGSTGYIPSQEFLENPKRYQFDTGVASYYGHLLFSPGHGNPHGIPYSDIGRRIVTTAVRLLALW